jgi:hypothetical protein
MKKAILWILAFIITLSTAVYQRITGPTYPIHGKTELSGRNISYELPRTHETGKNCPVTIDTMDPEIAGYLIYKRLNTADHWTTILMERKDNQLIAEIPSQPPAGKLEYKIILSSPTEEQSLTGEEPAIIRFKGHVPLGVLIPHVFVMFLAMLFGVRAGLEALRKNSNPRLLAIITTALLIAGGFILGPLVQKYAFGTLWSGFPLGTDLTDNKTLIALIGWIAALLAGRKGQPARKWVLAASLIQFIIFLIPHSLLGSEFDYSKIDPGSSNIRP